ncbi:hypothetical protein BGZ83_005617 [Gryganskiella cystojenkinii]|nr:hypothetical protein BGZ83_005617 [Gryganskiella cystojenkinii]
MTVDDSEMQRLWKLTNELTAQLVFNRSATLELKQQLAELQDRTPQGLAPILGANRNAQDYRLRIDNERLQEENNQLQEQIREYERWMEYIMTKFRLQNEAAVRLQEENVALQARLTDLGAVARRVMHEEYYTTESLIESLETENQNLREMLGVAEVSEGQFREGDSTSDRRENRVSIPSTDPGSHVASSGSEPDQPRSPVQERAAAGQTAEHLTRNRKTGAGVKLTRRNPARALSVETGVVRSSPSPSPATTVVAEALSPKSPLSPRSPRSMSSPSWSSSTSASSSLLSSPDRMDPSSMRFKTMSPPLEESDARAQGEFGPITLGGGRQGMIRLNTQSGTSTSQKREIYTK